MLYNNTPDRDEKTRRLESFTVDDNLIVWSWLSFAWETEDALRAEIERLKNPWGGHDRECLSGACHCERGEGSG